VEKHDARRETAYSLDPALTFPSPGHITLQLSIIYAFVLNMCIRKAIAHMKAQLGFNFPMSISDVNSLPELLTHLSACK
jgi:hypothetical protein